MSLQNEAKDIDVVFSPCAESNKVDSPWHFQLSIVFGRHFWYCSLVLVVANFSKNLTEFGTAFAEPLILQSTGGLAAGWQLLVKYSMGIPIRFLVIIPAMMLSRKANLVIASVACIAGLSLFSWTGGIEERTALQEFLFYVGLVLPLAGVALGTMIVFYLAVDIYPTAAAATGGAVCTGGGRLGAILAPFVFEMFPTWKGAFFLMIGTYVLTIILVVFLPDDFQARKKAAEEDILELKPLHP
jgi:hypothetical protein